MARLVVAINPGQQAPFKRLRWDAVEEQTKEYGAWREHIPAFVRATWTAFMGKWLPTERESDRGTRKLNVEGPTKVPFRTGKEIGCLRLVHS